MKSDCEKEEKSVKYGLRHKKTGKLLGYSTSFNTGSNFCVDTSTTLDEYVDQEWLVDDAYIAEYVRNFSTEWYNAEYKTPTHRYEPEELEVVKVEIFTDIEPVDIKVPTTEEYLEIRHGKGTKYENLPYLNYLLEEIKKGSDLKYNLYELQELIREGILKL